MTLTCPKCSVEDTPKLEVQQFRGEKINTGHAVKAGCQHCGAYIKFVKQTPEVLSVVDAQLGRTMEKPRGIFN